MGWQWDVGARWAPVQVVAIGPTGRLKIHRPVQPVSLVMALAGALGRLEPLVPKTKGYAASPSQPGLVKLAMVRAHPSMDSEVQVFEKKPAEPGEPEVG